MSVLPDWAEWKSGGEYTLGVEEEYMLLNPHDWSLAQQMDRVLPELSEKLSARVTQETHRSALELNTGVHADVPAMAEELLGLRRRLDDELAPLGLRSASAATHPFTVWHETVISSGDRYEQVHGSMRELARREPTFALHVHVGMGDPEAAMKLVNQMRAHLPLLLALSVNSPFWQGRDSGLASARTPLFQAFPRVGIPRPFADYEDWVQSVDLLIRCDAFADPSFLWWDVRPQPRFGTVEVRIMDAQITVAETAALTALVQCIARLETLEGYAPPELVRPTEVLAENRFIAARDGEKGAHIDPPSESRIPVPALLDSLLERCRPHAQDLGCEEQLERIQGMAQAPGARHQLDIARRPARLPGLVEHLADSFVEERLAGAPDAVGELRHSPASTRPTAAVAAWSQASRSAGATSITATGMLFAAPARRTRSAPAASSPASTLPPASYTRPRTPLSTSLASRLSRRSPCSGVTSSPSALPNSQQTTVTPASSGSRVPRRSGSATAPSAPAASIGSSLAASRVVPRTA